MLLTEKRKVAMQEYKSKLKDLGYRWAKKTYSIGTFVSLVDLSTKENFDPESISTLEHATKHEAAIQIYNLVKESK